MKQLHITHELLHLYLLRHYNLHYNPLWVLTSSRILHRPCLSLHSVLQFLTLIFTKSLVTTSIHLPLAIPTSSSFWSIIHYKFSLAFHKSHEALRLGKREMLLMVKP